MSKITSFITKSALLLLISGNVWAVNKYFDSSCLTPGDGTTAEGFRPKSSSALCGGIWLGKRSDYSGLLSDSPRADIGAMFCDPYYRTDTSSIRN